jgi:hypothetical protein
MLTILRDSKITVQAGTPMTVTGEAFLLSAMGAGRYVFHFVCLEISRGPGQRPGGLSMHERLV